MSKLEKDMTAIDNWISGIESDCGNSGEAVHAACKLALREGAMWGIEYGRASAIPWRDSRAESPKRNDVYLVWYKEDHCYDVCVYHNGVWDLNRDDVEYWAELPPMPEMERQK